MQAFNLATPLPACLSSANACRGAQVLRRLHGKKKALTNSSNNSNTKLSGMSRVCVSVCIAVRGVSLGKCLFTTPGS